ncbi:MAG: ABC transporter substrate-binding protein [Patescibacteria group bacterium]
MKSKIVSAIGDYYREVVLAYQHFSKKERVLFLSIFAIFIISGFAIGVRVNDLFLVEVPAYAGTLREGLIGVPRFINPVLASSDADRDLSALVYSGLVRLNTGEQKYIADLADYTISEDHLTYTFTIKDNAKFHDGSKVTSDDVIYTIKRIQDPESKSPRYPIWENIKAEKIDEQILKITLSQANSTFLESATIGILPSKNWKNATGNAFSSSVLNLRPIGSGPYKIGRVKIGSLGIAESYELSANSKFILGSPKIQTIILNFYSSNQELFSARKNGAIKSIASISPIDADEIKKDGGTILKSETPLPRIFAVFFNQNHNELFTSRAVREALSIAIPKSEIINSVFGEFATPINGPLGSPDLKKLDTDAAIIAAKGMLERDGWKFNTADKVYKKTTTTGTGTKKKTSSITLSFTLATA